MKSRRSTRRFKPDAVPKGCVDMILEAARWAPSAGNHQPWRFINVEDADIREKIGEIYQKIREADLEGIPVDSSSYKAVSERVKANFYRSIFTTAPLLIAVCAAPKESFCCRTYPMDCAVAIQNILLTSFKSIIKLAFEKSSSLTGIRCLLSWFKFLFFSRKDTPSVFLSQIYSTHKYLHYLLRKAGEDFFIDRLTRFNVYIILILFRTFNLLKGRVR